jgi:hypothetical protein
LLGNTLKPYQLEQEEEWSSCTWAEYESIFFQWYAISNRFGYRGYL